MEYRRQVDGVLGGDGGDGDELAATVRDDAGEVGPDVGGAHLCLDEIVFDLGPAFLEDTEAGLELVAGLLRALRTVLGVGDRLAGGLGECGGLGGGRAVAVGRGGVGG